MVRLLRPGPGRFRLCLPGLAVAVLAFSGGALAFGYPDAIREGTVLSGVHPRSIALGGPMATGSTDAAALFSNPSGLLTAPSNRFSIAFGPAIWSERVELNTYRQTQSGLALGSALAAMKIEVSRGFVLGGGIARVTDGSHEDVRYNYNAPPDTAVLESIEYLSATGGFWELLGGAAFRVSPWLSAGVSAGQRFGTLERKYEFDDMVGSGDSTWTDELEESALCWHAGLTVPFGLSSVGLSYCSGSDRYPARVALGGTIFTGSSNRGAFGAEGELRDPGGDDQIVVRVFGQYAPEASLVFCGGISLTEASKADLTALSLGLGGTYSMRHFQFDAALQWTSTSSADSSFTHAEPDQVLDSVTNVVLGISYVL
ncbi:hypothetical protein JW921_07035 [Candidatus Fermentibacterales bacterium]|nr:hypothetical protein [Candidatus Fermentibacterales bacterium]